jgi:hypothetical protein
MKAIVLENGQHQEIPEELIQYLDRNKIEWEHINMIARFWPENRKNTFEMFSNYPEGQVFICNTVFDGFQQLELMVELLHKLKDKKFIIKIQHPCLPKNLMEFYDEIESSITPDELELEMSGAFDSDESREVFKKIKAFKQNMNQKFEDVLKFHDIYWLRVYGNREGIKLSSLQDIKDNIKNYD